MTIYSGTNFVGFVDHAFTGTLSGVLTAPTATGRLILTAWNLRVTGAACNPAFTGTITATTIARDVCAIAANWRSAANTALAMPATDGLNITGGAASGVLNGYICFQYKGNSGALVTGDPTEI